LNGKGEISAEAHDVIVLYNFAKNEKVHIPVELREDIEKLGEIQAGNRTWI
jgi:hypothetical protein